MIQFKGLEVKVALRSLKSPFTNALPLCYADAYVSSVEKDTSGCGNGLMFRSYVCPGRMFIESLTYHPTK